MNIEEEFERNNLINNISLYELYYQVALGSIVSKTTIDVKSYDVNLEQALGSLYELIRDISDLEEADEILEREIQKQAAIDAVQNFINEHLHLVKDKTINVDNFIHEINDECFFNPAMIEVCNKQKHKEIDIWKNLITQELSNQIIKSIHSLSNQSVTSM